MEEKCSHFEGESRPIHSYKTDETQVMGKRSGSKTEVRREQKSGFMQRKRITDALRMSANQLK